MKKLTFLRYESGKKERMNLERKKEELLSRLVPGNYDQIQRNNEMGIFRGKVEQDRMGCFPRMMNPNQSLEMHF